MFDNEFKPIYFNSSRGQVMFSWSLTKKQYNNLLPTSVGANLLVRRNKDVDKYYFIGVQDEFKDAMNRCKYLD